MKTQQNYKSFISLNFLLLTKCKILICKILDAETFI